MRGSTSTSQVIGRTSAEAAAVEPPPLADDGLAHDLLLQLVDEVRRPALRRLGSSAAERAPPPRPCAASSAA